VPPPCLVQVIARVYMPSGESNSEVETLGTCFDAVVMGHRDKLPDHSRYREKNVISDCRGLFTPVYLI